VAALASCAVAAFVFVWVQRLGFVGGAFFPEAAGHALDVCGGAWFVVPGICVYVAWLGGGAIIPGTRTRPVAAREREGWKRPLLH
jgi:hypothetical protein